MAKTRIDCPQQHQSHYTMVKKSVTDTLLKVRKLKATVAGKEILHGVDLDVGQREFHVLMGPNGSGKSTFTHALMGHPEYTVLGSAKISGTELLDLKPHERAKLGLMLAFQNPIAVAGISLGNFLRTAYRELYKDEKSSVVEIHTRMQQIAQKLELPHEFLKRSINDGLSGGERKKAEMLQLLVLRPRIAVFDEIDTGLDVDALKTVAYGINLMQEEGTAIILITHYQRILTYLHPDIVHIMRGGRIVRSGDGKLARLVEEKGYAAID